MLSHTMHIFRIETEVFIWVDRFYEDGKWRLIFVILQHGDCVISKENQKIVDELEKLEFGLEVYSVQFLESMFKRRQRNPQWKKRF